MLPVAFTNIGTGWFLAKQIMSDKDYVFDEDGTMSAVNYCMSPIIVYAIDTQLSLTVEHFLSDFYFRFQPAFR